MEDISPAMPQLVRGAGIREIPSGCAKVLRVGNREIAIFNDRGTFYAVKNTCPHRAVPLHQGTVEDAVLTCPGHSWRFDLRTGDAVDHRPEGIRCYRVEVREDSVWVEIP